MKKIFVLSAILLLSASSAFAAASAAIAFADAGKALHAAPGTASATTALIGKMSNNVGVGWNSGTQGYALFTQHASGTKCYGSAFSSTSIFQTVDETAPGTVCSIGSSGAPSASDSTDFTDTAWKAL